MSISKAFFLDTLGYGCVGWGQERTHGGGGPIGVYSSEAYDGSVMMEQGKGKCNLPKDWGINFECKVPAALVGDCNGLMKL